MTLELVLFSGGGSGGHVFPALAVGEELCARGWRLSWLGSERGMERRLVEERELPYYGLPARAFTGQSASRRLMAVGGLAVSALRAQRLIRRLHPRVVVGTGGYASAPGVLGARLVRCPTVLLEPNSVAGAANRWLSRGASSAAVADAAAASDLRCPTRLTGVPVRSGFFEVPPPPAERSAPSLLILGGSQGARQLNRLLPAALERLTPAIRRLRVVHQVGSALVAEARRAYDGMSREGLELEVIPFIDDMPTAMGDSDLVISRAGAVTLAEICAAGRAALLIPLSLAGLHQMANARRLQEAGGARLLEPTAASPEVLAAALGELLGDRQGLRQMGQTLRSLARPQAAAEIADLVEEIARKG